MTQEALEKAELKTKLNATTYAQAVWDSLSHPVKSEAAIKFAMELTQAEKDGIVRDNQYPYEGYELSNYVPEGIFPYGYLEECMGDIFAYTAYDVIFNLMESYSDNIVAFPNPDEVLT